MTRVNGVRVQDTTNVKLAGVHDGMELLARNTTGTDTVTAVSGLIAKSARPPRLGGLFHFKRNVRCPLLGTLVTRTVAPSSMPV